MQEGDALLTLIRQAHEEGASDLILVGGSGPSIYRRGQMEPLDGAPLPAGDLDQMILSALDERQRERLLRERDLDFSIALAGVGRCRVNVHYQRRSLAAAIRFVPDKIPGLEELNLPPIVGQLAEYPRGLVLVTGVTGEGKSTTLAAVIDNRTCARHVITLEDPIEYTFQHDRCVIEQREIGDDSPGFASALRHVVRQKPDVILVGEMRDLETISTALTAAETGHLVLASLHTVSAAQTIERIVDIFDARQQAQVRSQLATTLRAVVCQSLFRNERDGGMVPACEILVNTHAISRAIRDNEIHLVYGMIETGSKWGMQPMDAAIAALVGDGRVSAQAALARAPDPQRLEKQLQRQSLVREPVATAAGNRKPWE
ncbi:MAG: type IV pilus twitching motility protein PilT [Planctomycetota bacterium]|jgi:twitching motility protein PilT